MLNGPLVKVYKHLVPDVIRNRVTMLRNAGGLNTMRKHILHFYRSKLNGDAEVGEVLNYLKTNPLRLFPYEFPDQYNAAEIVVTHDPETGLNYVLHQQKRMYFKRSWGRGTIQGKYNDLLIEQDPHSPHCYLDKEFKVEPGDVVADIGAAEGIFALSVIEKAKQIFLFETDPEWIEALQATFLPWGDKVKIIHKFVSDQNNATHISLDHFCIKHNLCFTLLKIDVDGAELFLLNGARGILSGNYNIKLAICTYHQQDDELVFSDILKKHGMTIKPSPGYMIFFYDPHLSTPFLRRGLLRAWK